MKSHYALLGIARAADADTIKKAFRREIARYHPDKLAHLGADFQDMAAVRARELTAAYAVLTNAELRAAYDASTAEDDRDLSPVGFPESTSRQDAWVPATTGGRPSARQDSGRAGRATVVDGRRPAGGDIIRRAAIERVRLVVQRAFGDHVVKAVAGFDLVCVSRVRRSLFRRAFHPTVFVRLAPVVDRGAIADAWATATKAAIEQKPWLLLLVGERLVPSADIANAVSELERRHAAVAASVIVVPVDLQDWSAQLPAAPPDSVRSLLAALRAA